MKQRRQGSDRADSEREREREPVGEDDRETGGEWFPSVGRRKYPVPVVDAHSCIYHVAVASSATTVRMMARWDGVGQGQDRLLGAVTGGQCQC
jgi:hypothetical protein